MKIGVSAWRLYGQRLGIGRYIEYLLKNWNAILRTDDQVSLYVHEPFNMRAHVFVLPSASDGFSLTLAEALSCGTPVITVNRAALGEVAHGYALTIEDPEVEALTDAMRRVLTDPHTNQTLRRKSLERGRELRWDLTARRTLDVLRQVAAS